MLRNNTSSSSTKSCSSEATPSQYINPELHYANVILSTLNQPEKEESENGSHWYCDPSIVTKNDIFHPTTTVTYVGGTPKIDVDFIKSVQNSMFFCLILDQQQQQDEKVMMNRDFTIVMNGAVVKVDRQIVGKHSPVLNELINSSNNGVLELQDTISSDNNNSNESQYLQHVLKFIHDGKLGIGSASFISQNDEGLINLKQLIELIKVADNYQVESLLVEISKTINDMIAMIVINNCRNLSELGKRIIFEKCFEMIGANPPSIVSSKVYNDEPLTTDFVAQFTSKMNELHLSSEEDMADYLLQDYDIDTSLNKKNICKVIAVLKADMTAIAFSELDKEILLGILNSKFLRMNSELLLVTLVSWVLVDPHRFEHVIDFLLSNDWSDASNEVMQSTFYAVFIHLAKKYEMFNHALDKLRDKLSQTLFKIDKAMGKEWAIYNEGRSPRKVFNPTSGEIRVLLLGLDASGKTTIMYKLKLGEIISTIPTIGFNVETLNCNGANMTVWDVGGQPKIRPLWRHYFTGTNIVAFVVDANDRERFDEACEAIQKLAAEEELSNASILIFVNKIDLPNSASISEIVEKLELKRLHNKDWVIQTCCARSGVGLEDGFKLVLKAHQYKNEKAELIPTPEEVETAPKVTSHFGKFDLKNNNF